MQFFLPHPSSRRRPEPRWRFARSFPQDAGLHRHDGGEAGFTLVELMVVIVIIGLLATVVLINVLPSQDRAMVTKARADISTLSSGMEQYRLDNMDFPTGSQGLQALAAAPAGLAQPGRYRPGGYIKKLPADPWGRPYQLQVPGRDGSLYEILSLGADGAPGGEGNDADISSSN